MARTDDPRLSYCGNLLRRYDHDRYLTCLFAPPDRREDLFAIYAFNHEIAKVAEVVTEPMAGQIRIQWWREGLDGFYDGTPRKHQVAEPLAAAIRRHGLTRAHFDRLLDARERDLDEMPPQDIADLEDYCAATSATLVQLALEILGVRGPETQEAGRRVGIAWALTGLLRAVPAHARQRRLMLPGDLVGESRLDPHDLFELRQPREVRPVVQQVAEHARSHLCQAEAARGALPKAAVPALLPGTLARQYLQVLARHNHDPFHPRVQLPLPGRPWRLLWAATTGRF